MIATAWNGFGAVAWSTLIAVTNKNKMISTRANNCFLLMPSAVPMHSSPSLSRVIFI